MACGTETGGPATDSSTDRDNLDRATSSSPADAARVISLIAASVRIGRAGDNEIELDDLRVSRHHAELRRLSAGGYEIVDLDSNNGTFVNGRRTGRQALVLGDFIGIGGQTLELMDGGLRIHDERNVAWFGAVGLIVDIGKKLRILDEVGFALEPSSILAVIGPSGSGKSTLLNALTGFRPADSGTVIYDGRDVYATFESIRMRMGLVPQADILHTQLTIRQALDFAAELRFPLDVTKEARGARIEAVMEELNLTHRANTRIDRLSGGQRKRVSIAGELLTEPSLLFLDEPTSGLDPGNEAVLMSMLKDLARAGRTVVVVTHSVQSLDQCDRVVVLAPGGRLAYYGPPSEALAYFDQFRPTPSYAEVFRTLEEDVEADWKGRFQADPHYERHVAVPLASGDLAAIPARPNIDPPPPPTPARHQLGVLIRRYLAVIRADRGFALTLALQAPIFGVLFALMFAFNVMTTTEALNVSLLVWLIVVGATWLGTSNSVREIVKELPIYRRERSIGLSTGAYVLSKVLVLATISAVQAAILVPIATWFQRFPPVNDFAAEGADPLLAAATANLDIATTGSILPSQLWELIVVAVIVGVAGMALGLLVSTLSGGLDRASTLLPVVLVAQIIVSVPLFVPPGPVLQAIGYVSSAQWGMAAAASTLDLDDVRQPYVLITESGRAHRVLEDPTPYLRATWGHGAAVWFVDIGIVVGLTVLCLGGTWLALRRTDPDLMEGRHPGRRQPARPPPAKV